MKQVICAIFVVLASLGTARALAQDAPPFSGRWLLVSPENNDLIAQELAVRWAQGTITIERWFKDGSHSQTTSRPNSMYYSSGVLTPARPQASPAFFRVRWVGDSLVFESGPVPQPGSSMDESVERRDTWSINADSMLVITVVEGQPNAGQKTTEIIYRKQWTVPPQKPATA